MGARHSTNISTSSPNLQSDTQNRRPNGTANGSRTVNHNANSHSNSSTVSIYSNHNQAGNEDIDLNGDINQIINAPTIPFQFIQFAFKELKCPICSKLLVPDDAEVHFVMCITKPRISYNGECVICLEDLEEGNIIARLPCLCIYHKKCIDSWFEINRSCPEHPSD